MMDMEENSCSNVCLVCLEKTTIVDKEDGEVTVCDNCTLEEMEGKLAIKTDFDEPMLVLTGQMEPGEPQCDICQCKQVVYKHFNCNSCPSCKNFFRRQVLTPKYIVCLTGKNNCEITEATRNNCKSCRFNRCFAVGMKASLRNKTNQDMEYAQPKKRIRTTKHEDNLTRCTVCGNKEVSHKNYGVDCCKSCKIFFVRNRTKEAKFSCITGTDNCIIDKTSRTTCKRCRYNRCLKAGFNPNYNYAKNPQRIKISNQQHFKERKHDDTTEETIEDEVEKTESNIESIYSSTKIIDTRSNPELIVPKENVKQEYDNMKSLENIANLNPDEAEKFASSENMNIDEDTIFFNLKIENTENMKIEENILDIDPVTEIFLPTEDVKSKENIVYLNPETREFVSTDKVKSKDNIVFLAKRKMENVNLFEEIKANANQESQEPKTSSLVKHEPDTFSFVKEEPNEFIAYAEEPNTSIVYEEDTSFIVKQEPFASNFVKCETQDIKSEPDMNNDPFGFHSISNRNLPTQELMIKSVETSNKPFKLIKKSTNIINLNKEITEKDPLDVSIVGSRIIPIVTDYPICYVCHDEAPGKMFYGGLGCVSCRAFFRRVVDSVLICTKDNNCIVNKKTRIKCKSCRYRKCLEAGMKPHLVERTLPKKVEKVDEPEPLSPQWFSCDNCEMSFSSQELLDKHMDAKHFK